MPHLRTPRGRHVTYPLPLETRLPLTPSTTVAVRAAGPQRVSKFARYGYGMFTRKCRGREASGLDGLTKKYLFLPQ